MKKQYIPIANVIQDSYTPGTLIPSSFLCSIPPKALGINLSAVRGFEVELTHNDQYKTIRIDFIPAEIKTRQHAST